MVAPVRFAAVRDGKLDWGPGPLPYRWTSPFGDILEVHSLTEAERNHWGFRQVEQRFWRDIDPEIEQMGTPQVVVEENLAVEVYSYTFVPGARDAMLRKIDGQAEVQREFYITAAPGQVMEYDEAYRQAQTVVATAPNRPEGFERGEFPFLDADVGVTVNPTTSEPVQTILEAAQLVVATRRSWEQMGSQIRVKRLAAKAAIRAAADDTAAFVIYKAAWV
jgi:hypothetical protein